MTQLPFVNTKQPQKSKFVSCIKINGVPILPPLITPEKRKELRRLKREAIKVEKRLQREKELKEYVSELYHTCTNDTENNIEQSIDSSAPLTNQLVQKAQNVQTFDITSNISLLDLTPEETSCACQCTKDKDNSHDVKTQLSFNVQCAQFVNNEFVIVSNSNDCKSPVFHLDLKGDKQTPPKLIRSNSYTLEAPSPALVEFLRTSQCTADIHISNECDKESHLEVVQCNTPTNKTFIKDDKLSEDCFDTSRTETELKSLSDCDSNFPISEGLQEFIVNNVPVNDVDYDYDNASEKTPSEGTSDWNTILKKIPSSYSRQILEILERQQLNHSNYDLGDTFDEIQLNPDKYSTPHDTSHNTVYYSVNEQSQRTIRDEKQKKPLTREQAASIISAAGRGFLVRRLMKTDKVQDLIQTINEAVLCAVQLHHDTLEYIEEADVELHRRLIQQVSAACYTFHSVFFAASIQDQMSFIAVDRQKKIDKKRRISSASSNASIKSNKSTSRSSRPSRLRKSLLRS